MRLLRLWGGAASGLLVAVSVALAQPPSSVPPPNFAPPPPPPTGIPSAPVIHETLPHESHSASSPSFFDPHCIDEPPPGGGLFVYGEYLYLKARRRAQDFVIVDPTLNATVDGSFSSAQFEETTGYRLGVGYRLYDGWELAGIYTYYHTKDDRGWIAPPGGALFATRANPFIDRVNAAAVTANLDYDIIDLELAKNIEANDRLELRLSAGGRWAEVGQKFSASYLGGTVPGAGPVIVTAPVYFDGFGIRVGGEGHWRMAGGLSVYAKAHGSLMSGEFRTSLRDRFNGGASSVNLTDKYESIVPVAELGVGVAYTTEHVRIKFGYELTNWFNFVEGIDPINPQSMGKYQRKFSDLSLEGFAVQIGFMF